MEREKNKIKRMKIPNKRADSKKHCKVHSFQVYARLDPVAKHSYCNGLRHL